MSCALMVITLAVSQSCQNWDVRSYEPVVWQERFRLQGQEQPRKERFSRDPMAEMMEGMVVYKNLLRRI